MEEVETFLARLLRRDRILFAAKVFLLVISVFATSFVLAYIFILLLRGGWR